MTLRQNKKDSGGPLGLVASGISGIVGLATEVHAHRKSKKASVGQQNNIERSLSEGDYQYDPPSYDAVTDSKSPMESYIDRPLTIEPLPLPVILPQRRPNSKSRGFVRAYAPDLWQYKGIDQQTFLAFLKDFHTSSQASPVFQVINVAAMAAGFAPSLIAMAVSTGVMVASTAASEVHGRMRTNTYLDKANTELFHPKNLHCMIMSFVPEEPGNVVLDYNLQSGGFSRAQTALKKFTSNSSPSQNKPPSKFRTSDGTTEGELAIPQGAQLIFPPPAQTSDQREGSDGGQSSDKSPSSWKSTRKFVSDYKDRRAQAEFAGRYGSDSKLAVPGAADPGKFASRFSDPNHPINSGSPLALLTGGKIQSTNDIRAKLTGSLPTAGYRNQAMMGDGYRDQPVATEGTQMTADQQRRDSRSGLLGGIKSMMKQDVLYLVIAEIPSQEERGELLERSEVAYS